MVTKVVGFRETGRGVLETDGVMGENVFKLVLHYSNSLFTSFRYVLCRTSFDR